MEKLVTLFRRSWIHRIRLLWHIVVEQSSQHGAAASRRVNESTIRQIESEETSQQRKGMHSPGRNAARINRTISDIVLRKVRYNPRIESIANDESQYFETTRTMSRYRAMPLKSLVSRYNQPFPHSSQRNLAAIRFQFAKCRFQDLTAAKNPLTHAKSHRLLSHKRC